MTAAVELELRPHWVYELLDVNDKHVYIGCSSNPIARIGSWTTAEWWDEVVSIRSHRFANQREGLDVERALIEEFNPPHNTVHTPRYDVGGWDSRRRRMAEAHEAGMLCIDSTCGECHAKAHELGLRCRRTFRGCTACGGKMPADFAGIEGAREAWIELRMLKAAADAWAWAAGDPVKAVRAVRDGLSLDDVQRAHNNFKPITRGRRVSA